MIKPNAPTLFVAENEKKNIIFITHFRYKYQSITTKDQNVNVFEKPSEKKKHT